MTYVDTITLSGIDWEKNYETWQNLIRSCGNSAKTFEIHCWNEERAWIELACRYGKIIRHEWTLGKVIAGEVTEDFIGMLLSQPLPQDIRVQDKMTPFFSIFFDNGISSEHYGTEINIYE